MVLGMDPALVRSHRARRHDLVRPVQPRRDDGAAAGSGVTARHGPTACRGGASPPDRLPPPAIRPRGWSPTMASRIVFVQRPCLPMERARYCAPRYACRDFGPARKLLRCCAGKREMGSEFRYADTATADRSRTPRMARLTLAGLPGLVGRRVARAATGAMAGFFQRRQRAGAYCVMKTANGTCGAAGTAKPSLPWSDALDASAQQAMLGAAVARYRSPGSPPRPVPAAGCRVAPPPAVAGGCARQPASDRCVRNGSADAVPRRAGVLRPARTARARTRRPYRCRTGCGAARGRRCTSWSTCAMAGIAIDAVDLCDGDNASRREPVAAGDGARASRSASPAQSRVWRRQRSCCCCCAWAMAAQSRGHARRHASAGRRHARGCAEDRRSAQAA